MIHTKPIKDLESIATGVAEFETKLEEYAAAGGTGYEADSIRKSDLLSILPNKLREDLLWNSTGNETYEEFRDTILAQSARIISLRRKGGANNVNNVAGGEDDPGGDDEQPEDDNNPISSVEDLIAAVNMMRKQNWKRPPKAQGGQPQGQRGGQAGDQAARRSPRKCANCGKEHEQRTCPLPPVPVSERLCWTCGKKNHSSRECPEKKNGKNGIKAVEDAIPFFGQFANAVHDDEGYRIPKKTAKVRPTPRGATLGDFIKPTPTKNRFNKLAATVNNEKTKDTHGCCNLSNVNITDFPKLEDIIRKGLAEFGGINAIFEDSDDEDETVAVAAASMKASVALDSGASDHVIGLEDLPEGVVPEGPVGKPFTDASGGGIKKFGKVNLLMQNSETKVGARWNACGVTRPLQSVSKTAGPEDGPGEQDIMFNNKLGVIMPPGLANMILKHIKPVATYPRHGGLYVCELELSSFPRQGPAR